MDPNPIKQPSFKMSPIRSPLSARWLVAGKSGWTWLVIYTYLSNFNGWVSVHSIEGAACYLWQCSIRFCHLGSPVPCRLQLHRLSLSPPPLSLSRPISFISFFLLPSFCKCWWSFSRIGLRWKCSLVTPHFRVINIITRLKEIAELWVRVTITPARYLGCPDADTGYRGLNVLHFSLVIAIQVPG